MSGYTPFKMKGSGLYGKGNQSPAKTHEKGHGPQQGPQQKSNMDLQPGEMEGTSVYKGDKKFDRNAKAYKFPTTQNKAERIDDYEDRAEFAGEDANTSPGPKRDAALKRQKNFEREADIIRDRKGEKSPNKFIDLTKGLRDKVAMAATGGAVGDKSKGTDRDSLMGKK